MGYIPLFRYSQKQVANGLMLCREFCRFSRRLSGKVTEEEVHRQTGQEVPQSVVLEQGVRIASSLIVVAKAPNHICHHIAGDTNPKVRGCITDERVTGVGMEEVGNGDEQCAENDNLQEWNAN